MTRSLWLILALCICASPLAHADCKDDKAKIKEVLLGSALAARNALFTELCAGGGALIDVTDPGLGDTFVPASFDKDNIDTFYDVTEYPKGLTATLLVAFLIDVDGSVSHATMLVGSGDKAVDQQALSLWPEVRLHAPARYRGKAVRTLVYWKMNPTAPKQATG